MKTLEEMNKKERKKVLSKVAKKVFTICEIEENDRPPENSSEKELVEWLTEAYQLITPTDKIPEEVVSVFAELGISPVSETGDTDEEAKEEENGTEDEKEESEVVSKTKEKKVSKKKETTQTKRVSASKKDQIKFFTLLIKSGKYSQKVLLQKGVSEFGELAKKSIADFLSYSKNPKYQKFDKLVIVDKKGNLRFEK